MRFLKNIFGVNKKKNIIYVDNGMILLDRMIVNFSLPGWNKLLPVYMEDEINVINKSWSDFQKTADEVNGKGTVFHPEIVLSIKRKLAGDALSDFAMQRSLHSVESRDNWNEVVSIYLKAWASDLNPLTLFKLGDFLVKSNLKTDAEDVYKLIYSFPTYAETYYGGNKDAIKFANELVMDAKERINELKDK